MRRGDGDDACGAAGVGADCGGVEETWWVSGRDLVALRD